MHVINNTSEDMLANSNEHMADCNQRTNQFLYKLLKGILLSSTTTGIYAV